MAEISVGSPAPDFTLTDDSGTSFSLSEHHGQRVLLYFYPQADTPACNDQNLAFTANHGWFKDHNILLVGISPDSVEKLSKFRADYTLSPLLLSDPEHLAIAPYGAWGEKLNYGKKYMGLIRSTVLVGADGKIEQIWPNIRAKGHVERLIKQLG